MNSHKHLSPEERTHLEDLLIRHLGTDLRNATMLLTALHTGARANELLGIAWQDVNLERGEVFIRTLKGGRPREVVVPKVVRDALRRLKTESPTRPFGISYNRLGEVWRLYRVTPKPFHCLRHTFAMRAYDRTKDIRFVQRALGHKSITNTMVYADYSYNANEFKKLMKIK